MTFLDAFQIITQELGKWSNAEERNEIACLTSRKNKKRTLNYILAHLCAFPRTPKGNVKRGDISTYPITKLGKGRACQKAIYSKASRVGVRRGVQKQVQRQRAWPHPPREGLANPGSKIWHVGLMIVTGLLHQQAGRGDGREGGEGTAAGLYKLETNPPFPSMK